MNDKAKVFAWEWCHKAAHDLKTSDILLQYEEEDAPYNSVCFHCQQAVEKLIKGYLVAVDISFPKTHNLADLMLLCASVDEVFSSYISMAEILTPYAVDIRYPDDFCMPSEQEAREAYAIALEIQDVIHKRMPKK